MYQFSLVLILYDCGVFFDCANRPTHITVLSHRHLPMRLWSTLEVNPTSPTKVSNQLNEAFSILANINVFKLNAMQSKQILSFK